MNPPKFAFVPEQYVRFTLLYRGDVLLAEQIVTLIRLDNISY